MQGTRGESHAMWRGWRLWALALALSTAVGLLMFSYYFLDVFVRGRNEPAHQKLIEELTGAWGELLVVAAGYTLTRRLRGRGARALGWHLPAAVILSALHTTWNWATRLLAFYALGYGRYDYGIMRLRYLMELPNDVIGYSLIVTITLLVEHYRLSRDREVRMAELEAEMSKVRLQALEAKLQPHFLFNALNTVSSVMYESVEEADRVLTRLADLLRRSLRYDAGTEVSLADEVETLELYLDVVRARFGDRLTVTVDIAPDSRVAAVPALLLQPLVENAIKHGDPGAGVPATIVVSAARSNGTLLLQVTDNGPGLSMPADLATASGVGLSTTRRRIERMYGDGGALTLSSPAEGGLTARVTIPFRRRDAVEN
jgi:two-component system, LytTR family, sensor kinase